MQKKVKGGVEKKRIKSRILARLLRVGGTLESCNLYYFLSFFFTFGKMSLRYKTSAKMAKTRVAVVKIHFIKISN